MSRTPTLDCDFCGASDTDWGGKIVGVAPGALYYCPGCARIARAYTNCNSYEAAERMRLMHRLYCTLNQRMVRWLYDHRETFPAPRETDCDYGCCRAGDVGLASELA